MQNAFRWSTLVATSAVAAVAAAAAAGGGGCDGATGSCSQVHATAGCDNPVCCNAVCKINPLCCSLSWDQACVDIAGEQCDTLPNPCPLPTNNGTEAEGCGDDSN